MLQQPTNAADEKTDSNTSTFSVEPADRLQRKTHDNVWKYLRDTLNEVKEDKAVEHPIINASIGMPTFPAPQFILDAATKAINDGFNQYVDPRGANVLIEQLAAVYSKRFNRSVTAFGNVQATRGSSGAFDVIARTFLNPNDEVVILEPIWNYYVVQSTHFGGIVKSVRLAFELNADSKQYEWKLDTNKLKKALNKKTKFLVFNTPHNPTGFILPRSQMEEIEQLLTQEYPQILVITDEVYEHMVYETDADKQHYSMASISEAMWQRSITISSASKTFSVTGWRVGWIIANQQLMKYIRPAASAHCGGGCHPLEIAIAHTLKQAELQYQGKENYYVWLKEFYLQKCKLLKDAFERNQFEIAPTQSTYFMLVDFTSQVEKLLSCGVLTTPDVKQQNKNVEKVYKPDWQFVAWLCRKIGVLFAPCSAFDYSESGNRYMLRVSFCIKDADIDLIKVRLKKLREILNAMNEK